MKQKFNTQSLALCALFTALIAVGAFIKIPIPLWPFTLQFLFANLAVLLLGRRDGVLACAAYIVLGLIGLPIFTNGGGPHYVLEPTFGCMLAFVIGGFVAGTFLKHRQKKTFFTYFVASLINMAFVYGIGMVWFYAIRALYLANPMSLAQVFLVCFLPTVGADLVKCLLCAILATRLVPIINKLPNAPQNVS